MANPLEKEASGNETYEKTRDSKKSSLRDLDNVAQ